MTLELDRDRARTAFIEARRALVASAEEVGTGRARGTLTAAALDRLAADCEAFQATRRRFLLLSPE